MENTIGRLEEELEHQKNLFFELSEDFENEKKKLDMLIELLLLERERELKGCENNSKEQRPRGKLKSVKKRYRFFA